MRGPVRAWLKPYGGALLGIFLAWLIRWSLDGVLGERFPYPTFLMANVLTAWYAGVGPSFLSIVIGALVAAFFFVAPRPAFPIQGLDDQIGLVLYLAVSCTIVRAIQITSALGRRGALRATRAGDRQRRTQRQIDEQVSGHQAKVESSVGSTEEQLRMILDGIPALISYVDAEGRYRLNNRGYELWFGHERTEIRGKHLRDVLGETAWQTIQPYIDAVLSGREVSYESVVPFKDGGARCIHASYIPQRNQHGEVMGFVSLIQDITERKQVEEALVSERKRVEAALRESEERLRLAAEGAHVGFWFWDLPSGSLEWTPMCKRLFGLPPDQEISLELFLDLLLPEDREELLAVLEHLMTEKDEFVMEYRTRWPADGSIRWIYAMGWFQCASDGAPLSVSGVAIDITERKKAEEALREADRRKDEFLATLAHELRNPLAPIRNAVQIMSALGPANEMLQRARGVIERQVQQMSRLVDDLLDVSRITRGKIQLQKERLDVAAVVRSALETSQPLIDQEGHELAVELPAEPLWVDADLMRLAQVLANLLNNAAKYTEKHGHIWLEVAREDGWASIRVRDDGIGIPAERLSHIFDMFTQVDTALGRAQGGLGIGLTLVRSLVEMHGGTVEAHSDGMGQGSEFVVRLPLVVPEAGGAPEERGGGARPDPEDPAEPPDSPDSPDPPGPPDPPNPPNPEDPPRARRVLVVDDSEDSADTLALLLQARNNEVRTAYSGAQALESARAYRPDVVLLDIGLPDISGYEVARRMRQHPELAHVVLVAQTGWGQEEDRRQSREAGIDYHMVKPVDIDALQALLVQSTPRPGQG